MDSLQVPQRCGTLQLQGKPSSGSAGLTGIFLATDLYVSSRCFGCPFPERKAVAVMHIRHSVMNLLRLGLSRDPIL